MPRRRKAKAKMFAKKVLLPAAERERVERILSQSVKKIVDVIETAHSLRLSKVKSTFDELENTRKVLENLARELEEKGKAGYWVAGYLSAIKAIMEKIDEAKNVVREKKFRAK